MPIIVFGFHLIGKINFYEFIAMVKFFGYEFLTIDDIFRPSRVDKGVLLTFDDAYRSFFHKIYPILKTKNIPAVLFVPVEYVGKYNVWDYKKVKKIIPLMTWKEIMEVSEYIEIGSHSLTHPYLTEISCNEAWKEIYLSKRIIENTINREVRAFCYPYGKYDENIRHMVFRAGYKIAFTTIRGLLEESNNLYEIKRIMVKNWFGSIFMALKYVGMLEWLQEN